MIKDFTFATTPQLHFGSGKISMLPAAVKGFGTRVLLITGTRSLIASPAAQKINEQLSNHRIEFHIHKIEARKGYEKYPILSQTH